MYNLRKLSNVGLSALIGLSLVACATTQNQQVVSMESIENSKEKPVFSEGYKKPATTKNRTVPTKQVAKLPTSPVNTTINSAQKTPVNRKSGMEQRIKSDHMKNMIVNAAKSQIGRPYRFGGNKPSQGFDCSGLVQYTYQHAGIPVPRSSGSQASYFQTTHQPEVGDVIFFKTNGRISHSGIYLGNNMMVHSPSSGKRVEIARIDQGYWSQKIYKYGKL